jgi:hypothetical protein
MEIAGVNPKLIRMVKAMMKNTKGQLNIDGIRREVEVRDGTCQGSKMGPVLCNLFLLPILQTWARDTVHLDPVLETEGGGGG